MATLPLLVTSVKSPLNLPVLSVTPLVFKKAAPFTLKPFSLAKIKLALFPNTSTVPLILEACLLEISFIIVLAFCFKFGFFPTYPPI